MMTMEIGDVDDGNPPIFAVLTITFVDVDVNNAVTWTTIMSSVCQ